MKLPIFAVLAVVVCAAPSVRAESFEAEWSRIGAAAAAQAHKTRDAEIYRARQAQAKKAGAPVTFAKLIVCAEPPRESGLRGNLRFYTRLASVAQLGLLPEEGKSTVGVWAGQAPLPDETAATLDDYRSASVTRTKFHYDLWSCDTQDYAFSFDTPDLVRNGVETSRAVKAHARIETRGQLDWEGELSCVAYF